MLCIIVSQGTKVKTLAVDIHQYCGLLTLVLYRVNSPEGYYCKRVKMTVINPKNLNKFENCKLFVQHP